jgi:enamine deaminase RidA (YjgF/YER057c/UK114 family)
VRREFFKGRFPTATGVIVAGLLREGALIEISAIAVLPDLPPLPEGERAG